MYQAYSLKSKVWKGFFYRLYTKAENLLEGI